MKSTLIAFGLVLVSSSAYALKVGDVATYHLETDQGEDGHTSDDLTMTVTAIDGDVVTTTRSTSHDSKSKTTSLAEINEYRQIAADCESRNGISETLNLAGKPYSTCRFEKSDFLTLNLSSGVPFGIVKLVLSGDGSTTKMTLTSFTSP